jgi:hypothetical protein
MLLVGITWVTQNEFSSKFNYCTKNNTPKIKKAIPPTADIPPIKTPNVFKTQSFWIQIRVLHFQ